jgi:hypothetical protein
MTKNEIIESTLAAMGLQVDPPVLELGGRDDKDSSGRYDLIVIQTLAERLPEIKFKTCADFAQLGVKCCDTCHNLYPHYEMNIEELPEGGKAWLCCAVRRATRGESAAETAEEIALEEALGGIIRNKCESEP